jgi:hypothetical protein
VLLLFQFLRFFHRNQAAEASPESITLIQYNQQKEQTMLSLSARTAGRSLAASFVRPAASTVLPAAAQSIRRGYHDIIVEHYENPRNVGSLDKNDESVGTVRTIEQRML